MAPLTVCFESRFVPQVGLVADRVVIRTRAIGSLRYLRNSTRRAGAQAHMSPNWSWWSFSMSYANSSFDRLTSNVDHTYTSYWSRVLVSLWKQRSSRFLLYTHSNPSGVVVYTKQVQVIRPDTAYGGR